MSRRSSAVNAYLAKVDPQKRAALQRLRVTIHALFPKVEEIISYGVPGFRLDGYVVAWMAAAKTHCSFFPGGAVQEFASELKKYSISKGTIRFAADETLPKTLVKKLITARIARVHARKAAKPKK
jgi:uncharacterized protein YdhG (YjbR/CyaY superfamily)